MPDGSVLTKSEAIALETSYWEAMKAKDGSRTAALSGDAAVVTGAQGVMSISKDKMSSMTEQGDWTLHAYKFEDVQVACPTNDIAIVGYVVEETVTMGGQRQTFRAADLSTWIRGERGWECHAHSETILKDDGKS